MQDLNENDDFPKEEENQKEKLTKEQILSRSRNENKRGDERTKQIAQNAGMVMIITLAVCVTVIFFTEAFVHETTRNDLLAVMWCMLTAGYIYQSVKLKKKIYIACAVIYGANAVINIIMWIMTFCG